MKKKDEDKGKKKQANNITAIILNKQSFINHKNKT